MRGVWIAFPIAMGSISIAHAQAQLTRLGIAQPTPPSQLSGAQSLYEGANGDLNTRLLQGGALVGAGNALYVQPGTGASFSVVCTGGCSGGSSLGATVAASLPSLTGSASNLYESLSGGLYTQLIQGSSTVGSGNPLYVQFPSVQTVSLASGSALVGGVEIYDGAGSNKLAVNSSGQVAIQAPLSLPLPTGAATAANQASVQGAAWAAPAPAAMVVSGAVYNTVPLTLANTQSAALQADSNGYLKANVAAGAAVGATSSNFSSSFPGAGTAIGAKNSGGNMTNLSVDASNHLYTDDVSVVAAIQAASITPPFPIHLNAYPANWTKASATATGTTSPITLFAAAGAGMKNYLTGYDCSNTSNTPVLVYFLYGTSTIWTAYLQGNNGKNFSFPTPISTSPNASLQFESSTSVNGINCSATGYWGS
jgi:hypothetical protein